MIVLREVLFSPFWAAPLPCFPWAHTWMCLENPCVSSQLDEPNLIPHLGGIHRAFLCMSVYMAYCFGGQPGFCMLCCPCLLPCGIFLPFLSQFVHFPVDGHFGYFHFWAIMNRVAVTMLYRSFCGHLLTFLFSNYQEVDLLSHWVGVCLTLLETSKQFSEVSVTFYSHQQYMGEWGWSRSQW